MIRLPLIPIALSIGLLATVANAEPLVYVAAGSANKIIVIDAATDKVVGEFDNIDNPHSIVSTPDGEYVISGSLKEKKNEADPSKPPKSTIYLVHPAHGHVMLTMAADGIIHHQAITPDGRYVISTHPTRGNISVADLQQNKVVRTVKTGKAPNYALVSKDGKEVYVSNSSDGTISIIDVETWMEVRTMPAGPGPEHLALSGDGKTLFVTNPRAGTITAIEIASGTVIKTYQFGGKLHGLDISDDGTTLFVTNRSEDKLIALNPQTDVRREIPLSPAPYHLETIHSTGKVYVSSSKSPRIWVIDQSSAKLIGEITISGEGHQMTIVR